MRSRSTRYSSAFKPECKIKILSSVGADGVTHHSWNGRRANWTKRYFFARFSLTISSASSDRFVECQKKIRFSIYHKLGSTRTPCGLLEPIVCRYTQRTESKNYRRLDRNEVWLQSSLLTNPTQVSESWEIVQHRKNYVEVLYLESFNFRRHP